jgi:hypothetical protein
MVVVPETAIKWAVAEGAPEILWTFATSVGVDEPSTNTCRGSTETTVPRLQLSEA